MADFNALLEMLIVLGALLTVVQCQPRRVEQRVVSNRLCDYRCHSGRQCVDTLLRCVMSPCPNPYQCQYVDGCGGCPPHQECLKVYPNCIRSPCEPINACVDTPYSRIPTYPPPRPLPLPYFEEDLWLMLNQQCSRRCGPGQRCVVRRNCIDPFSPCIDTEICQSRSSSFAPRYFAEIID